MLFCRDDPTMVAEDVGARPTWIVATKADRGVDDHDAAFAVSAVSSAGLAELRCALAVFCAETAARAGATVLTNARHRGVLADVRASLAAASDEKLTVEFVAEHLRAAMAGLGRLTGRVGANEVLGEIFRAVLHRQIGFT